MTAVTPQSSPQSTPTAASPTPSETSGDGTDIAVFADTINASLVVVRQSGQVVVVQDGAITRLPLDADGSAWSDGVFVYVYRWVDEEPVTQALTLDGEVVCETASGWLHHATQRSDGTYVMAVEDADLPSDWDGERIELPLYAVDCETGERQPIEAVSILGGDSESESTIRIAGRTFRALGDAEGNADVINEDGRSVNGGDYAGYHVFNQDASLVAYGLMQGSPHYTGTVAVRDSKTTEKLWTVTHDDVFVHLQFHNNRLLVHTLDFQTASEGNQPGENLIAYNATTGEQEAEHPAPYRILHIGDP